MEDEVKTSMEVFSGEDKAIDSNYFGTGASPSTSQDQEASTAVPKKNPSEEDVDRATTSPPPPQGAAAITEKQIYSTEEMKAKGWKSVEFGEGSLGLTMRRTKRDAVHIFEVTGQAEEKGLQPGDEIVQLGDFALVAGRVDKDTWRRAVEHVKSRPRPLSVWYIPKHQQVPRKADPLQLALDATKKRVGLIREALAWSDQIFRGRQAVENCEAVALEGRLTVCQKRSKFRSLASMVVGGDGLQRLERYGFILRGTNAVLLVCEAIRSVTDNSSQQKKLSVTQCIVLDGCVKLHMSPELFLELSSPELHEGGLSFHFSHANEAALWRAALAGAILSSGRDSGGTKREVLGRCDADRDTLWRHHLLLGTGLSLAASAPVIMTAGNNGATSPKGSENAMISEEHYLDARDARGRTALHVASSRGATELVRALLELGADATAFDDRKSTPLHEAARGRHDATVSLLLAVGGGGSTANNVELVDVRDDRGFTPFDACGDSALEETEESAERLSRTMLALAAWGGGSDCSRDAWGLCLSHRLARYRNFIALQLACKHSDMQAKAKLLTAPPADYLYEVDPLFSAELLKRGATALHVALAAEAVDSTNRGLGLKADHESEPSALARCVDVLLGLGVDPYDKDADGQTAMSLAIDFLVTADAPCSEAMRLALCGPLAYFDDDSSSSATNKNSVTEKLKATAKIAAKTLEKKKKGSKAAASWTSVVDALDDILIKRKAKSPGSHKKRIGSWFAKLAGQSVASDDTSLTSTSEAKDEQQSIKKPNPALPPNFASRAYRRSSTDEDYRKELFGKAASSTDAPLSTSDKLQSTTADFDGLKDAMNERGERLTKLSDKAEELASASEEFEKMCARLNREKQRSPGWW